MLYNAIFTNNHNNKEKVLKRCIYVKVAWLEFRSVWEIWNVVHRPFIGYFECHTISNLHK